MPTVTGALWDRAGVTREVFLIGRYAIKIPKLVYGWKMFLNGLLANMQEREFAAEGWPELCPIVFSLPGGWLVVMRRARVMTDEEFAAFDFRAFVTRDDDYAAYNLDAWGGNARNGGEPEALVVPVEAKADSFGWLDGRVVAIDYGN
jgi:hypothetical protein